MEYAEFALQHRYAFVLHTDEDHPHVHLVLKAVGELGVRLNIKKATLRGWRSEFARNLRQVGVAASATERAVRGETRSAKKDGIYRASLRNDSTYVFAQAEAVAAELRDKNLRADAGRRKLFQTRKAVEAGWHSIAHKLEKDGHHDVAYDVRRFVEGMPALKTERERIAAEILPHMHQQRIRDQEHVRQR